MAAARKARMFALGIGVGLVLDAAILAIVDLGKHAPYVNLKPKTKEERALVPYYEGTPWPYPEDKDAVMAFLEHRQVQTATEASRGVKKASMRNKSEQATARVWQRMRTDIAAELVSSGDYDTVDQALRERGLG